MASAASNWASEKEGVFEVSGVVLVQAVVQATGLTDGIALFSSGFVLREVGSNPTAATPLDGWSALEMVGG